MGKDKDTINAVIFGAFAVFGLVLWFVIPVLLPGKPGFQIDTRLFPRVIAVLLLATGALNTITTCTRIIRKNNTPKEDKSRQETAAASLPRTGQMVGMIIIMVFYALLMEPLGFLLSTFLAVTASLIVQRVRKISAYIAVYSTSFIIYCIFYYILKVQLP